MIGEVINHLWQSTLFAIAAGLLTIAFRNNRAEVRYWLWFSASVKFFAPFSLLMGLGSYLGWTPLAKTVAAPAVSFMVVQITPTVSQSLVIATVHNRLYLRLVSAGDPHCLGLRVWSDRRDATS